MRRILAVATLVVAFALPASAGIDGSYLTVTDQPTTKAADFYEANCWEDEVVVLVVHDPYGLAESDLACIPGDNIPWTGFRPDR